MRTDDDSPIMEFLSERGLSLEGLASLSGVSGRTLYRWRAKGHRLQSRSLQLLADALQVDESFLRRLTGLQFQYVDQQSLGNGLFATWCFCLRLQRLTDTELTGLDLSMLATLECELATLRQRIASRAGLPAKRKRLFRPRLASSEQAGTAKQVS